MKKSWNRICPICKSKQIYHIQSSFCRAKKMNSPCRSCSLSGKNNPQYGKMKNESNFWMGHGEIGLTYWNSVIYKAKKKNREISVSISDVWAQFLKQNRKCALSGVSLSFGNRNNGNASLDRIDSTKGYIVGNIQWVHKDVNRLKSNFTEFQFVEWCKLIAENRT